MTALEAKKFAEKEIKAGKTPTYSDLREWIEIVDGMGELKRIDGVDWNLEMGTLAELVARESKGPVPAVLFDNIKGYPKGYTALFAQNASFKRMALNLGLPLELSGLDLVRAFRQKLAAHKSIPHKVVNKGPVLENVLSGKDVNLLKFPVPFMHELDGGRFIGTACLVITRDPEEGWVNFGAYRGMVHNENSMGLYISPGKHGRIQRQKYFDQGKPCPVIISVGQDPILFIDSGNEIDYGVSEFDYAGGLKGAPIEVIEGKATGLPFPAQAEIVIEGFMDPKDVQSEGPFGEWTLALNILRIHKSFENDLCLRRERKPGRLALDDFDRRPLEAAGIVELGDTVVDLVPGDHKEDRVLAHRDDDRTRFPLVEIFLALDAT